ncbi:MAG: AAA family ATPase [Clostridiales bacterium]|nr:AAA family ATPase [Clostridiales bacterium]
MGKIIMIGSQKGGVGKTVMQIPAHRRGFSEMSGV